jgi:hypothetical protein
VKGLLAALAAAAMLLAVMVATPLAGAAPGPTAAQNPDYQVPLPQQPQYLNPFPVVRLAGRTTRTGVRVTLLRVRSPRGSTVTVRCLGGRRLGCPYKRATRKSPAGGLLRFRSLQRALKGGLQLEIVARRGNTIGKYTAFKIRKRKAPSRTDACSFPGDPLEPAGCP